MNLLNSIKKIILAFDVNKLDNIKNSKVKQIDDTNDLEWFVMVLNRIALKSKNKLNKYADDTKGDLLFGEIARWAKTNPEEYLKYRNNPNSSYGIVLRTFEKSLGNGFNFLDYGNESLGAMFDENSKNNTLKSWTTILVNILGKPSIFYSLGNEKELDAIVWELKKWQENNPQLYEKFKSNPSSVLGIIIKQLEKRHVPKWVKDPLSLVFPSGEK